MKSPVKRITFWQFAVARGYAQLLEESQRRNLEPAERRFLESLRKDVERYKGDA